MALHNTYDIARAGGRHGAFYRIYQQRSSEEIQRGIRSFTQRIQEHRNKISDPTQHVEDFDQLDLRQPHALLTSKWPADIQRLQEQQGILEGILLERAL